MDSNSLYCNIYKGKIKESIYKVTKLVIEDTNGKNYREGESNPRPQPCEGRVITN